MNMKKIVIFITAIVFLLGSQAAELCGASGASLNGRIADKANGEPLTGVSIVVEGTPWGAITDIKGNYTINRIKPGKYTVLVSYIGYKTLSLPVVLLKDSSYRLDAELVSEIIQTSEVVVSASKRVQAVQEVPISVAVINNLAMQQRNATRLDDALQYLPGVSMNGEDVSVRGSAGYAFGLGSRVSLLLDGIPMLSGDLGDMKLNSLPLFNVQRIEVVKGAGSALYGTSALGGVVNVITKEPSERADVRVKAFAGVYTKPRFKQWEYSDRLQMNSGLDLGYTQKFDALSLVINGSFLMDESYRKYDESYRYSLFSKVGYDFSENTKVRATFNISAEDKDDWVYWNSLDSATLPPTGTDENITIFTGSTYITTELKQLLGQDHFMFVRFNYFNTHYYTSHDENDPKYRESKAKSYYSELQLNSRFSSEFLLTSGLTVTYNNGDSKNFGLKNQTIVAAYAQAEINAVKDVTFNAGARYDYDEATGLKGHHEFSPKAGVLWVTPWDVNIRASVGKGFRSPSISERFASIDYQGFTVIPNPELKPEKSLSCEIGFNYDGLAKLSGIPLNVDLCGFYNKFEDLIDPVLLQTDIQFRNITEARIMGVEAVVRTYFPGIFGFETGLTVMDPVDLTLDQTLKYRSKFLWYSRAILQFEPFELQADFRYMAKFRSIDKEFVLQIRDYDALVDAYILDARLIYNIDGLIGRQASLTLNVRNLLDYYYTEMIGNLAPTRNVSLQLFVGF